MTRRHKARSNRHVPRKSALDNEHFKKIWKINEALRLNDLAWLRRIAREPGGFGSNRMRQRVWPVLLRCDLEKEREHAKEAADTHPDENQVKLDIVRAFNVYPQGISAERKKRLQSELDSVIRHVLRSYPSLHYYQGFHDICSVFLLIFGAQDARLLLKHVALFFMRDAMLDSMDSILQQLTMIFAIFKEQDYELYEYITEAGVLPYYSLSWVIAWFSHDLNDLGKIARIFDVFLSSTPLMPIYLSAALVLARRDQVLTQSHDMSAIHTFLSKVPQKLEIEALIVKATELEKRFPPLELQRLSGVALDEVSVVNTYDDLWIHSEDLEASREAAHEIAGIPSKDRKPILIASKPAPKLQNVLQRLRETYRKDATMWTLLVLGAGMGMIAMLLSNNDLVREWLLM